MYRHDWGYSGRAVHVNGIETWPSGTIKQHGYEHTDD